MNRRIQPIAAPVVALLIAACGPSGQTGGTESRSTVDATEAPSGALANPTPAASPPFALGPVTTPPPGAGARFDSASMSADGMTVTLRFVGGKPFSPTDPCSSAYTAWAEAVGDVLYAAVVDVTPDVAAPSTSPPTSSILVACNAMGYDRTASVTLSAPFAGARVEDVAGNVHFARPPEGLVELAGLPSGWSLRSQGDVNDSPTGRWQRVYASTANPPLDGSRGHLDFYQAFGQAAGVSGGDERREVTVNGKPAVLFRSAPDGELVLVWLLGSNGLALVANETDFPADALIRVAESARLP